MLKRLRSLLPTKLPVGMQEFEKFSSDVIELSGQFADADSMKFALASQILHLGPQRSSVPLNFFVRSMRKAAANQVASQVFQYVKTRQDEQRKQAAEATAAKQQEMAANNGSEKETRLPEA